MCIYIYISKHILAVLPMQDLIFEHIPFISTVSLLQKQPLVQDRLLHLLTAIMSLQDKVQLQSRYSVPAGQAIQNRAKLIHLQLLQTLRTYLSS